MTHVSRPELGAVAWRKSSYSNQAGGDCVEVADGCTGIIPIRDSKNPSRPGLIVSDGAWDAFVNSLK
ncbi:DUF397 domain-containing protein [Streptomyces sp. Act-28]